MTSNETKILKAVYSQEGKSPIPLIAKQVGLSGDYIRLICRSLERAGHLKLIGSNFCQLSPRGRKYFGNVSPSEPAVQEPIIVAANVTLLTDDPSFIKAADEKSADAPVTSGQDDEEENQENKKSEDANADQPVKDEELDRVLADLEPSSNAEAGLKAEQKEEASKNELASEAESQATTESAAIEEEKKMEAQETDKIEEGPADSSASVASSADAQALADKSENSEKAAPKEEPAKPASSFGLSFKKVVNWFTEKK